MRPAVFLLSFVACLTYGQIPEYEQITFRKSILDSIQELHTGDTLSAIEGVLLSENACRFILNNKAPETGSLVLAIGKLTRGYNIYIFTKRIQTDKMILIEGTTFDSDDTDFVIKSFIASYNDITEKAKVVLDNDQILIETHHYKCLNGKCDSDPFKWSKEVKEFSKWGEIKTKVR